MKKVMVISFSDLNRDPRVNRQLHFLRCNYKVVAVGTGDPLLSGVEFIQIVRKPKNVYGYFVAALQLLTKRFESYYWKKAYVMNALSKIGEIDKDLVLANDIESLPLAIKIAGKAKVIFDAHEYSPRQMENSIIWRIVFQRYKTYLCNKYIPQLDGMITVCEGIANQYEKDTGVQSIVIINTPHYIDLKPYLLSDNDRPIRLIHHGAASPGRKLENMIHMMDYLDKRFELSLMLIDSSKSYFDRLKRMATGKQNIRFIEPVTMPHIAESINKYDIGVFILEPNTFNHHYVLPNKLFEFIQARLAVAIGPSPEMAAVVNKYDCGIVANDFSSLTMARCLNEISREKINYYKKQSHQAAKVLNAENNKGLFLNYIEQVLKD